MQSSDEPFNSVTIATIISSEEHLHKDTETPDTVNPAQLITKCIHSPLRLLECLIYTESNFSSYPNDIALVLLTFAPN